jgi:hypothetical protein
VVGGVSTPALALAAVMDEMAQVLAKVTGLRVTGWPPASGSGRFGYISYPARIAFDQTYGRGEDIYEDLPVVVCVPDPTDRGTRDRIAPWCDSDGPQSVKAVFEAHTWQTCGDVMLSQAEFDTETNAGVDYLCVIFRATVSGPGKGL